MKSRMLPYLAALLAVALLAGCGGGKDDRNAAAPSAASGTAVASQSESTPSEGAPATASSASSAPAAPSDSQRALSVAAKDVVEALRDRDLKRLASWIDPKLGLRFSPYAAMTEADQIFKPEALPSFKSPDKIKWGTADGSGDPIELSFRDYFDKFVYDKDFDTAPSVSANKLVGKGNTVYNGQDTYAGSSFVEFHFPGFDASADGMDWESLILTFVQDGSDWRLVALTHAQWTI
ncbi:hypothetical protein [Cohnella hashimotonis]|uniref:Nuclear transport factor 2 family protein n=1 Tax=Cohnella hashimotonis TaxID=2826895 RepID=A0ABT6TTM1_9BACL|nr:hypothetical protein [Cohnella hashimotonis]MDI4650209.1 hypothetical protein [Cohnella hashimotonis]